MLLLVAAVAHGTKYQATEPQRMEKLILRLIDARANFQSILKARDHCVTRRCFKMLSFEPRSYVD